MGKDNPLFLGENTEELFPEMVQGKHILLDLKVPLCECMKELREG